MPYLNPQRFVEQRRAAGRRLERIRRCSGLFTSATVAWPTLAFAAGSSSPLAMARLLRRGMRGNLAR